MSIQYFNRKYAISLCAITLLAVMGTLYAWTHPRYLVSTQAKLATTVLTITAPVNGTITTVYAEEGRYVKKGDPLLTLNNTAEERLLKGAESRLKELKQQLTAQQQAVITAEKLTEARQKTVSRLSKEALLQNGDDRVSRQDISAATQDLDEAFEQKSQALAALGDPTVMQEKIKEAETAVTQAKSRLSPRYVVAPSEGYVTGLTIRPGQTVQPQQPLMTLIKNEEWWVIAHFEPQMLNRIEPNQVAMIKLGEEPQQQLTGIVQEVKGNTVKIKIVNPDPHALFGITTVPAVTIDTKYAKMP